MQVHLVYKFDIMEGFYSNKFEHVVSDCSCYILELTSAHMLLSQ